jgi:N-formylglutamate amidohydrolase
MRWLLHCLFLASLVPGGLAGDDRANAVPGVKRKVQSAAGFESREEFSLLSENTEEKKNNVEDLVFIQKGTLPIIVSAPHGGKKPIPDVPERLGLNVKLFAKVRDFNTDLLAEKFVANLEKQLGGKVWVVMARFDRKYLDANRPADGAYENDHAKPIYDAYHGALDTACKFVKEKHGAGLLLDIHGQGQFEGEICRGTQNGKSVKLLKERHGWQAVVGRNSVLGQMERAGYKILPKCDAAESTKEESQFNGGYMVQTYGSHGGYAIDAIQLEFGSYLREKAAYPKTAAALADAVAAFHDAYLKK